MKLKYILIAFLAISCGQKAKEKKGAVLEPEHDSIKTSDSVAQNAATNIKNEDASLETSLAFNDAIDLTKAKGLPQIETTDFNSFIEEGDYDEVDVQLFKLESIYPNFYREDHNYRAIAKYKLALSNDFHSVVITVEKGDNEMESVLITYDREGNSIDHQVVSYDEIAEGWSRIVSRISENQLTVNHIFWSEIKQIEQVEYTINYNGKIEKVNSQSLNKTFEDYALINGVLMDIGLEWIQMKTNLITAKKLSGNTEETVVILPQVVDEGEQFFEVNPHIILVNGITGEITHNYFGSFEDNGWSSDAMRLDRVTIDTTPYEVSESTNVFGVRLHSIGMSEINPYESELLSLFVRSGNSLNRILNNFEVMGYGGEWVNDCVGETVKEQKTLHKGNKRNNGYFNLLVKNQITITTSNFKNENEGDECVITEARAEEEFTLKFNGSVYKISDSGDSVSVLQLMLFSKLQAINYYGEPKTSDQFVLSEVQGEFRNGVLAKYTQDELQSDKIRIDELTWEKNTSTWITTWYQVDQEESRPIEVFEWKKGTEF